MPPVQQPFTYPTAGSGACATAIRIWLTGPNIAQVEFIDGCPGNHRGLQALVQGRPAQEVIQLLQGTPCGTRPTSCPDQLAKALQAALQAQTEPAPA